MGTAAVVALAAMVCASQALCATYHRQSDMPVRLQWEANAGYCGETAFIAAGMSVGQYTSQWTARSLAAPGVAHTNPDSQLLLETPRAGSSWDRAARAMRLQAVAFPSDTERSSHDFMVWVKQRFLSGGRVIIGVFNNTDILGESLSTADATYDHIVPVMGVTSKAPLRAGDTTYRADDQITIGDNGLFTPFSSGTNSGAGNTNDNPRGSTLYTYRFDRFQKSRAEANTAPAGCDGTGCSDFLYSVPAYPRYRQPNFGVAVTGVVDQTPGGREVIPVSVSTSTNTEGRQDGDAHGNLRTRPAGQSMSLTITVRTPDQSKAYVLYEYTDFAQVPTGRFNAAARTRPGDVAAKWEIAPNSGATVTRTIKATTDGTYVFRAVPATAP